MLIDKLKIRNSFTSQAIAGKQCNLLKNVAISVTSTNIPFFGLTLQLYFRSWALLFCCQSQIITPVTPPISPVHPLPSHYFPAYIHGLQFSKQYCKYQRPLFVDNVFFFTIYYAYDTPLCFSLWCRSFQPYQFVPVFISFKVL